MTVEEEVTGTQGGDPTSLLDYSHIECPTPLNVVPMDEYLDPKATVPLEVLSINRKMAKDQQMKEKK